MKKWILLYLVIIFTVLGMGMYIHRDKVHQEIIVPGTVVNFKTHHHKSTTNYYEIVEFELYGISHRFTSDSASFWKPKIGAACEVAVDPEQPDHARVRMWPWLEKRLPPVLKQNWGIVECWLLGCICMGFGWFIFWGHYEFFRRAIIVPGRVIRHSRSHKGRCHEIVEYHFDGQRRTVQSDWDSYWPAEIGTERQVGIDRKDTDEVQVRSLSGWIWMSLVLPGLFFWVFMLTA